MDVVVTCPKQLWAEWCAEGDLPGDPWTGRIYDFYLGGQAPNIRPGERVYVVAHGWLRGYAPLTRIEWQRRAPLRNGQQSVFGGRFSLQRHGGAIAVTLSEPTQGFRGWRYRWWEYSDERAYDFAIGPEPGGRLFDMPLPGATPSG